MLIIVVLFITLGNNILKQLTYQKVLCLKIMGIYSNIVLNFSICKMVDSEYSKSLSVLVLQQ